MPQAFFELSAVLAGPTASVAKARDVAVFWRRCHIAGVTKGIKLATEGGGKCPSQGKVGSPALEHSQPLSREVILLGGHTPKHIFQCYARPVR